MYLSNGIFHKCNNTNQLTLVFFRETPVFKTKFFFYIVHRMLKLWLLKCFFFLNYSVKQNFCMGFLTCNFFEYLHIFCRYYKIIALNKLFSNLTKLFTNASAAFIQYRIKCGGGYMEEIAIVWMVFRRFFFAKKVSVWSAVTIA